MFSQSFNNSQNVEFFRSTNFISAAELNRTDLFTTRPIILNFLLQLCTAHRLKDAPWASCNIINNGTPRVLGVYQ